MSTSQEKSPDTSKPQETSDKEQAADLLANVLKTPESELSQGVAKREGLNGSAVEPIYSVRKMKCYSVTESELWQIGLANIAITAFASLGSAMLAFAADIYKDTLLAEKVPDSAAIAISYLQPLLLVLGGLFWVFAGVAMFWRKGMIKIIKTESSNS